MTIGNSAFLILLCVLGIGVAMLIALISIWIISGKVERARRDSLRRERIVEEINASAIGISRQLQNLQLEQSTTNLLLRQLLRSYGHEPES